MTPAEIKLIKTAFRSHILRLKLDAEKISPESKEWALGEIAKVRKKLTAIEGKL